VLVALMVSTSLAVATFVSAWLVPPYLALMGAILFAPPGRRDEAAEAGPVPVEILDGAKLGAVRDVEPSSTGPAASAGPSLEPSGSSVAASEASPAKARRGKGRGRGKKAKGAVEPNDAAWIRIGPGQFVRADAPGPGAPFGETSPALAEVVGGRWSVVGNEEDRDGKASSSPLQPTTDHRPPATAPGPGVTVEGPIPLRKEDAPEGAPGPDIAAIEPVSACAGVIPPGMPGPIVAGDGPESAWSEVATPSEPGPVLPVDEPAPAWSEASPSPAPERGPSMVEEKCPPQVEGEPELESVEVEVARAEVPEPGPAIEEAEDNGNAPEAPALDRPDVPEIPPPARPTTGTLRRSLRGAWPPSSRASRAGRNIPSPAGRGVRTGRRHRGFLGLRHHVRRDSGRSREARRTFPPRSPPVISSQYRVVSSQ
jgi:hypothetical protein